MIEDTIASLAPRVRTGEVRAERLTEDALATISRLQPSLNAFISVMADDALAAARQADREIAAGRHLGPLHGMPLSVKDLIDITGVPTTAASRLREGRIARRDAPVIAHLRHAGAVFVGKTNLHEFAFGTTNEDSGWGAARHPLDPTRSPGGSSGGSAIAVRTGMSIASLGTDTGGSIRIPAAACGVVGLKPAWGEVSADGVVPLSRQLDHVGPLAKSVEDASILFDVMRGTAPRPMPPVPDSLFGLRLATLGGFYTERISEAVDTAIADAYERLRTQGARLSPATLPHAADVAPIYLHLVFGDAAAYHATALAERPHAYTDNVRLRLEMARHVLAEDYVRALRGKAVIAAEVERALDGVDALVLPALAIEAPLLDEPNVAVKSGSEPVRTVMLRCTQPFNLSGHPAISLPLPRPEGALPVGVQLVGRIGHTDTLLEIARRIEHALQQG